MSKKTEEELEEGYARCPISSCIDPVVRIDDMIPSSFDYRVLICPDCKGDGN